MTFTKNDGIFRGVMSAFAVFGILLALFIGPGLSLLLAVYEALKSAF